MSNGLVFVNPGSGPVDGATDFNATVCAQAFASQLATSLGDVLLERTKDADGSYVDRGRFAFTISRGERSVLIHMPGLPLNEVRYTGEGDQNIWHFPRLYVDHSSYVWLYAQSVATKHLTGEFEVTT